MIKNDMLVKQYNNTNHRKIIITNTPKVALFYLAIIAHHCSKNIGLAID
jgi:hypothetical protein